MTDEPAFDVASARKVIDAERQERSQRIRIKLEELMTEERFTLAVVPTVIIDGKLATIAIVPQD